LNIYLLLCAVVIIAVSSCIPPKQCDIEPAIAYEDFFVLGDSAILIFSFKDGDGDIGLKETEITAPYEYNCFLTYMEKKDGIFVADSLPIPFWYRIPYTDTEDEKRCVSGNVEIKITPTYYNWLSADSDTIKFEIYILDRALHKSNIIETPEIITPK